MPEYTDNWIVQVRKGLMEFAILAALRDRERYGFELVRELTDIQGLGITEGTIYPLLSRLRLQGLVTTRLEESSEGPARKYYALSKDGAKTLAFMERYWKSLVSGIEVLHDREKP